MWMQLQQGSFLCGVNQGFGLGFHHAGAVGDLPSGEAVSWSASVLPTVAVHDAFGETVAQVIRSGAWFICIRGTLSTRHFCDLVLEDAIPDHSMISRFHTRLVTLSAWDGLLGTVNEQSYVRGLEVTVGAIADSSLTESRILPRDEIVQ